MNPGSYSYTITGAGLVAYGPIPGNTSCTAGVTCVASSGNTTFTGNDTFGNINSYYLVDGVKFTTPQAAMTAANAAGGGTVLVPCSTFMGPTTWYSNVSVRSMCSPESTNVAGSQGIPNNTTAQTVFTYASSLTWTLLQNISVEGITFDFGNNLAGLVLNSSSFNNFRYLSLIRCGSPTIDCLQLKSNGAGGTNNTIFNQFDHLRILGNQSTNARNGIQLNSTTSATVTLNTFYDTFITGQWQGCIDSELNSDTNYFYRTVCAPLSVIANSYILGFNLLTPGSDQDADGGLYDGLIYSGASVTSIIRAGQSNGNVIRATIPGGVLSPVITGGSPTWSYSLMGLPAATQDSVWAGRLAASAVPGGGPASGSVAGDITAARTATLGSMDLGGDGQGVLFRSGNTGSFQYGVNQATFPGATGMVSDAAVEYCGATTGATQACAKTVQTLPVIVWGDVLLNTATSQSITTLPFTDALYSCSGSDLTTLAGVVSFSSYASASVTITETGGVNTDHLRYLCVGH